MQFWNDEDERPTSSYSMGTCSIYSSPKRPKAKPPVYGFKFVNTEKRMPLDPANTGKKKK